MNNVFDLINLVKKSNNPQALVMNMLEQQAGNNPILQNVIVMANSNNTQGIENIARNLAKEKGVNIDELIQMIKG